MKLPGFFTAVLGLATTTRAFNINYTTVTGYFLQDEATTDAASFDYTATNFGLITRSYDSEKKSGGHIGISLTQWERFYNQIVYLNNHSPPGVDYKVLFLGRHGEGWHNAAESYYGTPAWNCYWSLLDGNSTATWNDADLTPSGIQQAQIAHDFWQTQIESQHIHTPDSYFVSPLTRALRTANITFTGLHRQHSTVPFHPLVKESVREGISLHTCDHRRSRSYIQNLFPRWEIENGFTETDQLWNGVTGETSSAQDVRSKTALDSIFSSPYSSSSSWPGKWDQGAGLFVSVTSHSGEISSILRVIGHRQFSLNTGAVIPVLVRAEVTHETAPSTSVSWTVSAHCTAPPVASVTSCLCASSAAPVTTPL